MLSSTAEAWTQAGQRERALPLLQRLLNECPGWEPTALLRLGQYEEARGRQQEAADYYDRLDCDYPSSPRSVEGAKRLAALRGKVPPVPAEERYHRDLRKASFLSDEGRHREAIPLLRSLLARTPPTVADGEIVRMRLVRAQERGLGPEDRRVGHGLQQAQGLGLLVEREQRARARAEKARKPDAYQTVVSTFPGSQWAEEALVALANFYMKDQRLGEAAPYFNTMLTAFPDGRYLERASWWVGWWEYVSGRFEGAAAVWENVAQKRKDSVSSAAALYWAARARQHLGQQDKAQALFAETVKRFKHTYHGQRAADALGLVEAGASTTHPSP
ncbi:MAG TPA: tetratricopeptide repeat protein, partial [Planctomycetota bacterium]|nr:tetratricopeptide repeat protein [Planctomycetota bacterium]